MSDPPGCSGHGPDSGGCRRFPVGLVLILLAGIAGCRSTAPAVRPAVSEADIDEARQVLTRPLPGPLAALYHLRVPKAGGGLRLSVLADGDAIRMTVSENFGSAVMIAGSNQGGAPEVFDLREGCRLEGVSAGRALGIGAFGLHRIVAMLGGRLPVVDGDRVRSVGDGALIEISGSDWTAVAELSVDPPRILSMRGTDWAVELGDHTASVPGRIRVDAADGEWAEMELVRLKWDISGPLPAFPDLPLCRR